MRNFLLVFVLGAGCVSSVPAIATQTVCESDRGAVTCTSRDGAHEALAMFNDGRSLNEIATRLRLASDDQARELVHFALLSAQRRYFRAR